jgi:hypothetical protein
LQQVASALKEHGATIVAITPQLAEASRSLIEKQRISFDLLSDPGNAYAAKLGLRFALPDDLKGVYLSFGNDLAVRNGEASWTLPAEACDGSSAGELRLHPVAQSRLLKARRASGGRCKARLACI